MSEILTIDIANQISSTSEPTMELRWQMRWRKADFAIAHDDTIRVLQQRWKVTDYRGRNPIGVRGEWRDVPTETEA